MVGMMSIIGSALAYKAMRANLVGWTNGDETAQCTLPTTIYNAQLAPSGTPVRFSISALPYPCPTTYTVPG